MTYYYLGEANTPVGPVTDAELDGLIREGRLPADPSVAPVGSTEWRPLSQARAATASPAQNDHSTLAGIPLPFRPTLIADLLVGRPMDWMRRAVPAARIAQSLRFCTTLGHLAIFGGLGVGVAVAIIGAVRLRSWYFLLFALLLIQTAAVGQYLADQTLAAADALMAHTPHRVSSRGILACFALILRVVGTLLIITGFVLFVVGWQWVGIVFPLLWYLLWWGIPGLMLIAASRLANYPELLNVEIAPVGSGEEAVGLLGFLSKSLLKVAPIFFCTLACLGFAANVFLLFRPEVFSEMASVPLGLGGLFLTTAACAIPFLAYFAYLIFNLGLELMRAILILPGKFSQRRTPPD